MNFLDQPEIEYGDVRVDIAGGRVIKLQSISFGAKVDKELLYGEGTDPIGTQNGNRSYTVSVGLTVGALLELNDEAVKQGGVDVLDLKLPIVIAFRARGARQLRLIRCVAVSFTEYDISLTQGDKKGVVTLPGIAEKII